jgi:hypothetical protein
MHGVSFIPSAGAGPPWIPDEGFENGSPSLCVPTHRESSDAQFAQPVLQPLQNPSMVRSSNHAYHEHGVTQVQNDQLLWLPRGKNTSWRNYDSIAAYEEPHGECRQNGYIVNNNAEYSQPPAERYFTSPPNFSTQVLPQVLVIQRTGTLQLQPRRIHHL